MVPAAITRSPRRQTFRLPMSHERRRTLCKSGFSYSCSARGRLVLRLENWEAITSIELDQSVRLQKLPDEVRRHGGVDR